MKHLTIVAALEYLAPGAQYTIVDNQITWECDLPQPSDSEIERVGLLIENRISRKNNYPPIGDQLDALYHAGVFPAEMAAKIKAVKDAYPLGSN